MRHVLFFALKWIWTDPGRHAVLGFIVRIVGSNAAEGLDVRLLCLLCVG